jgi:hypothetical protein
LGSRGSPNKYQVRRVDVLLHAGKTMKDGPRFNYENNRWASNIEALRDKYRPVPVKTMFVGESPPANGEFFYADKNTGLRRAFEGVLTAHGMAGTRVTA